MAQNMLLIGNNFCCFKTALFVNSLRLPLNRIMNILLRNKIWIAPIGCFHCLHNFLKTSTVRLSVFFVFSYDAKDTTFSGVFVVPSNSDKSAKLDDYEPYLHRQVEHPTT